MENTVKLIRDGVNSGRITLNSKIINEIGIKSNKEITINFYITNGFKKHCILSNKPLKTENVIYHFTGKISRINSNSKSVRLYLNPFIIDFFNFNSDFITLKKVICNNAVYYELI